MTIPHVLLDDPTALVQRVSEALFEAQRQEGRREGLRDPGWFSSAVLLLLAPGMEGEGSQGGACVVLNKRSQAVRQPGDLCCPGGGISPRLDPALARLLGLPGLSLRKWPHYREWRDAHAQPDRDLPLILAAALRESFEEMRVDPRNLTFLGLLPEQPLRVRRRAIHPAVAWLHRPQPFRLNWEVEKVVSVPLRALLDPSHYARLRVQWESPGLWPPERGPAEFPCFRFNDGETQEILWGATFSIVVRFLGLVFGFEPPSAESLQEVSIRLNGTYLTGQPRNG